MALRMQIADMPRPVTPMDAQNADRVGLTGHHRSEES
jgi:hypothetical protein